MTYENRTMKIVERSIDLPNNVKLVKMRIEEDVTSYGAWFVVFPDNTKDIEMDISDVLAEKFASHMWGRE